VGSKVGLRRLAVQWSRKPSTGERKGAKNGSETLSPPYHFGYRNPMNIKGILFSFIAGARSEGCPRQARKGESNKDLGARTGEAPFSPYALTECWRGFEGCS
jgi:hypothetical protein